MGRTCTTTELAARVSAKAALPVFHAYPGRAGNGTPVKSNGEPERWVLAARLSRVTKKDQARGDALIDGIYTQDQRGAEWARDEGHVIVHVTKDRNISGAVPPWERPELGPWLTDPVKLVLYDGVVAYTVDRLSRDYADVGWLRKWAEQHHKKLYIIKERLRWPDQRDGVLWSIAAERAYEERRETIERITRQLEALRNAGKLTGRPPFGYTSEGDRYDRRLAPTDEGRKYMPLIYAHVIEGWSLEQIAEWLRTEGVKPPLSAGWWAATIGLLIKNPTYMGHRCAMTIIPPDDAEIQDGKIVRYRYGNRWIQKPHWIYGKTIHRCEPLVGAAVWKQANEALKTRTKRGHSDPDRRAMLSGVLYCAKCPDSPMYKTTPSKKLQATCRYLTVYYRCFGRGSQRQSCGNMIPLDALDAAVDEIIAATFDVPVMKRKIIYGNEAEIETRVEEIKFEIQQLGSLDLSDEDYDRELARLRAERDHIANLDRIPDRIELVPTGDTYYALWQRLSIPERGAWLAAHGFRVTADKEHVTVSQETGSATVALEKKPSHARTRMLYLGKCHCGCGIDLYGVNANKKYINGAHAAKAQRRRRFQAADSELYQGLRHAVCSGAKAQPAIHR
jgi:site-specific DNA recombinase